MSWYNFDKVIGKIITGVVMKYPKNQRECPLSAQLYLIFDDNTCYEIYAKSNSEVRLYAASEVDKGGLGEARRYFSDGMDIYFEIYKETSTGDIVRKFFRD